MKRWDLLLVVAVALVTVAVGSVDWRAGAGVLGVALAAVWYWLGEAHAED